MVILLAHRGRLENFRHPVRSASSRYQYACRLRGVSEEHATSRPEGHAHTPFDLPSLLLHIFNFTSDEIPSPRTPRPPHA